MSEFESPFEDGSRYGLPRSTLVHRLANIAGTLETGENCRIDAFVTITGHVKLGDNCHLGTGAAIFAAHGFTAGDGVSVSPGAKVFTATVDVDADCLAPHAGATCESKPKTGPVKVGRYSCIGANAVVLPGVTIGEQVQVAALACVTRDLPSQGVYGGQPAKYLRERARLKYGQ